MRRSYVDWYDEFDSLYSATCYLYFCDCSDNRGEHWELDEVSLIENVHKDGKPLDDWDEESIKAFIEKEVNAHMKKYMKAQGK